MSLTHADGSINKTDKSTLMRNLEKKILSEEPPQIDLLIIDSFFFLHTLTDVTRTFGEISKKKCIHIM